jgi:hypothetical protein
MSIIGHDDLSPDLNIGMALDHRELICLILCDVSKASTECGQGAY